MAKAIWWVAGPRPGLALGYAQGIAQPAGWAQGPLCGPCPQHIHIHVYIPTHHHVLIIYRHHIYHIVVDVIGRSALGADLPDPPLATWLTVGFPPLATVYQYYHQVVILYHLRS